MSTSRFHQEHWLERLLEIWRRCITATHGCGTYVNEPLLATTSGEAPEREGAPFLTTVIVLVSVLQSFPNIVPAGCVHGWLYVQL